MSKRAKRAGTIPCTHPGCGRMLVDQASLRQHLLHGHPKKSDKGRIAEAPVCPYCRGKAVLLRTSETIYNGTDYGPVWACLPCEAWVGCHRNSRRFMPLGRLANAELRAAKHRAHEAFDPLWQAVAKRDGIASAAARERGYAWLGAQLGLDRTRCHMGKMSIEECNRVVVLCAEIREKLSSKSG